MKNYVSAGDNVTITVTDPVGINSGDAVFVGSLFGIASRSAAPGENVAIVTRGVFELPKAASQSWTVGAKVYWDAANKRCTTVATGNTLIGAATVAVAGGANDTTGTVRLNGTV
ncbi:DUF2190 family protein [Profundibacter sp.]